LLQRDFEFTCDVGSGIEEIKVKKRGFLPDYDIWGHQWGHAENNTMNNGNNYNLLSTCSSPRWDITEQGTLGRVPCAEPIQSAPDGEDELPVRCTFSFTILLHPRVAKSGVKHTPNTPEE
jgi:hypothetical protein